MDNNDILRRLRYILHADEAKMCRILALGSYTMKEEDMRTLLLKEDDEDFLTCRDEVLANFLDGLITDRRGPSDKGPRKHSVLLNNNTILKKLRIAFELKEEEMLQVFQRADFEISKSELSALFRKKGSRQYRECGDQLLRRFLQGLAKKEE